jgi:hypothetical protein
MGEGTRSAMEPRGLGVAMTTNPELTDSAGCERRRELASPAAGLRLGICLVMKRDHQRRGCCETQSKKKRREHLALGV